MMSCKKKLQKNNLDLAIKNAKKLLENNGMKIQ